METAEANKVEEKEGSSSMSGDNDEPQVKNKLKNLDTEIVPCCITFLMNE